MLAMDFGHPSEEDRKMIIVQFFYNFSFMVPMHVGNRLLAMDFFQPKYEKGRTIIVV